MGKYYESGAAEKVTVQNTGTYGIVGYGAQGGGAPLYNTTGGNGAKVGGSFNLQRNEVLELFVGQQGGSGAAISGKGGGGGGTFVLADVNAQGNLTPGQYTLLLAAGGGGGAASNFAAGGGEGGAASITPPGNGSGGAAGTGNYSAGGGAGFKGNGVSGSSTLDAYYGGGGTAVTSSTNPGAGGAYVKGANGHDYSGNGGFGGGGAAGASGGGGGGGYTGGGGGYFDHTNTPNAGVGGSSFFTTFSTLGTANAAQMIAGENTGNGLVTITPSVCFAAGTRIATARGQEIVDVAVEDLAVGDLVVTASGAHRPIRWLGHCTVDCRAYPRPHEAWPVRIAAHAFGDNRPARDLLVSQGHAICLDFLGEVLIPAGRLVNGATITRHPVDQVTYWHVELDSHDILLAENLPAESFVDCGNRAGLIEREGEFDRTAAPHTPADFCRPFYDKGAVIDAVRARLASRAEAQGWRETHDMDMHLIVDGVRMTPDTDGDFARFVFPASARHVTLASATYVPGDRFPDLVDWRTIGLSLRGLEIGDGLGVESAIGIDDPRLGDGLHAQEPGAHHRFTTGHLALPPELWAGCRTHVVLRVHHDPRGGGRWLAPASDAENIVQFSAAG